MDLNKRSSRKKRTKEINRLLKNKSSKPALDKAVPNPRKINTDVDVTETDTLYPDPSHHVGGGPGQGRSRKGMGSPRTTPSTRIGRKRGKI